MNALKQTLVLMSCAGLTSLASAASVHVKFDNPIFNGSGYDVVNLTFPNQSPATGSTTVSGVPAGRFQGTATNVQGVDPRIFVDSLDNLYMYCYDLYEHVGSSWDVDYTINLNGERARTLDFLGAVNAVMNTGKATYDQFAWLHPVSGNQGAAIQLGIWESKYDTGAWSMSGGAFSATGLEAETANWMQSFFGQTGVAPALNGTFAMTLESAGRQDMITGDPPTDRIPEPNTAALMFVALSSLAWARARPRRPARVG